MGHHIPSYWNTKHNVTSLVVGTAIFAEVFILIFRPFDSAHWVSRAGYDIAPNMESWFYLGFATLAVLTAMGVIAVSRSVMYRYAKRHEISYLSYGAWMAGELLAMTSIYTIITLIVANESVLDVSDTFTSAMGYTACILLIPYTVFMLYFSMRDKAKQLESMQQQWNEHLEAEGLESGEEQNIVLNFKDEKGDLKFSIRSNAVFYIESADNYVLIHYLNSGKVQRFILRTTLKKIEDAFGTYGLIRCHRSLIVNLERVQVLRKTDDGLFLDFDVEGLPNIPVSKTYSHRLLERITEKK